MLLWGNGYAEIERDNAAQPVALWPRNPARTRPVRLTRSARIEGTLYPVGTLVFHTSETFGDEIASQDETETSMAPERIILAEDMLHMPGLSLDGRLGQSTINLARELIGTDLGSEKFAAKFFGNGAVPQGILTIPGTIEPKALETLRRSWAEAHGGENAHKTAVLEAGVEYKPIGIDPEKSQFLETRHFQRQAIAGIFNVPLHMLGEKEAAKSSVEQTAIEFLNYCLHPWIDTWEQELKRKLMPAKKKQAAPFFVKFDVQRLLYPDAESRSKFYTSGKTGGYLDSNDIREMEDMNPIEDGSGDVYWMPVNMQDAANPLTAPHIGGKQNLDYAQKPELTMGGAPQNTDTNKGKKPVPQTPAKKGKKSARSALVTRYVRVYRGMFKDAAGRILKRDEVDEMRFRRCFLPALYAMTEALSSEFSPEPSTAVPASDFHSEIVAYMEGMRCNLQGVRQEDTAEYAAKEVRRAAETLADMVEERYNPNHANQPRHPDGTFHDGKKPFYLGRHAQTDDDDNGVWSGQRNVPINSEGEQQIEDTIEQIKTLGIKRIICSDLLRTRQTAYRYAGALGIPVVMDARLRALKLGPFEGLNEEENADALQMYIDEPDTPIPGGESINGYRQRVTEALDEARAANEGTGPILAITHSSAAALYLDAIRGIEPEDLEKSSDLISPAGVVKISGRKVEVVAGKVSVGDAA